MSHWQLGIVIPYHTIFNSHGRSHDVQIRNGTLVNIIGETIRLLVSAPEAVVVSWEWVESSNHVPSGAEFWSGVTQESANIWASKRNTNDVMGHDSCDRVPHVSSLWEVIPQPSRSVLAHAGKCASFNYHGPLFLLGKPLVSRLRFHGSEQGVSIELGNIPVMEGI